MKRKALFIGALIALINLSIAQEVDDGINPKIVGKWKMSSLYFLNAESYIPEKEFRIKLELRSDSSYVKTLLEYHPFDSFGKKLPAVNTLDKRALKKNRKEIKSFKTATGKYYYDKKNNELILINDSVSYSYKAIIENEQLVLTDTVDTYLESNIVIQTYTMKGQ